MAVKVLVFKGSNSEREGWIAHVLDYDIMAEGTDIDDAMYRLSRLTAGELLLRKGGIMGPLEQVQKAPIPYWKWYETAEPLDRELTAIEPYGPIESECRLVAV